MEGPPQRLKDTKHHRFFVAPRVFESLWLEGFTTPFLQP